MSTKSNKFRLRNYTVKYGCLVVLLSRVSKNIKCVTTSVCLSNFEDAIILVLLQEGKAEKLGLTFQNETGNVI